MAEKSFEDLPAGDKHLREERLSGEDVYGGIFLKMKRDKVSLPDGEEAIREYLTHPGAVAIVAILDDGRVLLERQYRYPIAKGRNRQITIKKSKRSGFFSRNFLSQFV